LVPRLDEFEGQGQRSNVKVTRNKKWHFRPFRRPVCGLCLVKNIILFNQPCFPVLNSSLGQLSENQSFGFRLVGFLEAAALRVAKSTAATDTRMT